MNILLYNLVDFFFRALDRVLRKVGGHRTFTHEKGGRSYGEQEDRLSIHWQNLNRDEGRSSPHHGRCWLRILNKTVGFNWNLWQLNTLFRVGLTIGDEEDLLLSFSVLPVSLHLSLERFFPSSFKKWWTSKYKYNSREVCFYASLERREIFLHWSLWTDPMGGRGTWRDRGLFLPDAILSPIFGREKMVETVKLKGETLVHMPEGPYPVVVTFSDMEWRRPRLPLWRRRISTCGVDIEGGIPFEGKGENSWDCGEDALFSLSGGEAKEGDFHAAAVRVKDSVDRYRRKYGGRDYPHPSVRLAAFRDRQNKRSSEDGTSDDGPKQVLQG